MIVEDLPNQLKLEVIRAATEDDLYASLHYRSVQSQLRQANDKVLKLTEQLLADAKSVPATPTYPPSTHAPHQPAHTSMPPPAAANDSAQAAQRDAYTSTPYAPSPNTPPHNHLLTRPPELARNILWTKDELSTTLTLRFETWRKARPRRRGLRRLSRRQDRTRRSVPRRAGVAKRGRISAKKRSRCTALKPISAPTAGPRVKTPRAARPGLENRAPPDISHYLVHMFFKRAHVLVCYSRGVSAAVEPKIS